MNSLLFGGALFRCPEKRGAINRNRTEIRSESIDRRKMKLESKPAGWKEEKPANDQEKSKKPPKAYPKPRPHNTKLELKCQNVLAKIMSHPLWKCNRPCGRI